MSPGEEGAYLTQPWLTCADSERMTHDQAFVLYLFIAIGSASLSGALADDRGRRMGLWFGIGLWLPLFAVVLVCKLPRGSMMQSDPEPQASERMQFAAVRR